MCCSTGCILGLIAIIFPPFPVWVKRGLCSADSLINLALCCLGFIPGLLHAWYIIAVTPDDYGYQQVQDVERGSGRDNRVRYVYAQPRANQSEQNRRVENMHYGAIEAPPAHAGTSRQGDNDAPPPAYDEAIRGDNKVQKS